MPSTRKKTLYFDFDGVLADTVDDAREFVRMVANERGRPMPTDEFMRSHGAGEIFKAVGVRFWQLAGIISRVKSSQAQRIDRIRPFPWIEAILKQSQAHVQTLGVISSNSTTNIEAMLSKHGLLQHFNGGIHGDVGVFSKARAIKKAARRAGVELSQVIYVGDEGRDADAARKAGVSFIGVAWGYQSEEFLRSRGASSISRGPEDWDSTLRSLASTMN